MANDSYIADRIEQHLEGPGYHVPLALKFGEWQEIVRALRGSNGPSSELLDLRARIDAIGIEILGSKYLYRVDEIKRFDATKERS